MIPRRWRSILPRVLILSLISGLALSAGCRRERGGATPQWDRVVDETGILSGGQRQSIADYLEFIESRRDVDYRVVVMDGAQADLVREGVSRYGRLGIGERTEGKGLLLLVNVGANEARVEVGYDLEHQVRDVEASSMIREFLAPYFSSGDVAMGIEASVERLVMILDPSWQETSEGTPLVRSGGAGATALLEGIDSLTPATKARLQKIMVPQANPEDCVHLELALMHRGIYYQDVPLYDGAWRRSERPSFPARRVKSWAAELDGPFSVARSGNHAIAYREGERALQSGPQFLRRTEEGWILDTSSVFDNVIYDYSNRWAAVDGNYPYLALIKSVYDMQRVTLKTRGPAWAIDTSSGS